MMRAARVRRVTPDDGEAGTYIVEVALVLPLFVTLVFGFISASLLLFVYCEVTYAAQAAARYAALRSTYSTADTASGVTSLVNTLIVSANGGTVATPAVIWDGSNVVGTGVSVTVQVSYPSSLPFLNVSRITLSSTAQSIILH